MHANDGVIRYYDISTETTTNTREVGYYLSVSGSIVAFYIPDGRLART